MKALELFLRVILKLLEVLSGKPSEAPPITHQPGNNGGSQSTQHSRGQTSENTSKLTDHKSVIVYNDEVNDLLSRVMAAHRATQEADMNEIIRLRQEVSRLQEELIIAKASVQGKNNAVVPKQQQTDAQSLQGTDTQKSSDKDDIAG